MSTAVAGPSPYPIAFDVEPQRTGRNKMTVGFRLILAIPHLILVGGPGPSIGVGWPGVRWVPFGGGGVIGIAAGITAIVSWFAIVFTGKHPRGLWDFANFYMRWRANAAVYTALLRDEYPPFGGDDPYPVTFTAGDFPETRDRWLVGLRLILAIPHLIILFFLGIAWLVTAVIGWFSILRTGDYPEGLYKFAVGVLRWSIRVQTYLLLMRDEYPPFSLE